MLARLKEDFKREGNSKTYRKGELVSVRECKCKNAYIVSRYTGMDNWVKDIIDKEAIEIVS
ncbi:hypothetical protein LI064_02870 [Clostridium perfringens]|uniref:hypothetical protein n=1 Tax=Clostridium perfringens TaxID=1502 RepID=UPI00224622A8|nr:hypothetical protein [Clostridium perfringens]MCX0353465.1 hypothetical protein [Clostridium perfringens]